MKTLARSLPVNLLILLFIYAAFSKMADFDTFRGQMRNQSFPREVADALVYLLPFAELLAAGLLLLPKTEGKGLGLSLVLLLLFTGYIALVLAGFWNRVPCSCGGVLRRMGWRTHLLFNLFFLLLNFLALYHRSQDRKTREHG